MSWRNLWRHPRRTLLTALAFAIGVFLLIISLGLGDGMHERMIETGIRLGSGHVVLEPRRRATTVGELNYLSGDSARSRRKTSVRRGEIRDHVRGTAPRLLASGLISSATNSTGVQIVGGLPEREVEIGILPDKITEGTFLEETGRTPSAVIGNGLAEKLGVDLGSKVVR